MEVNPDN